MTSPLHSRHFTDTATLWEVLTLDSAGDPSFAVPRQIFVRWEERPTTFIGSKGETESSNGLVAVDEALNPGDWLFLGTSAVTDPTPLIGAYEIKAITKVKSPSNRYFSFTAFLSFRRTF